MPRQLSSYLPYLMAGGFLILSISICVYVSRPKIAFIRAEEVFKEFNLSKQLQSRLDNTQQARELILDSLKISLRQLKIIYEDQPGVKRRKTILDSIYLISQQIDYKENEYSEATSVELQQYNEQILTQLRTYLGEFRTQKGYDILIGLNESSGLIMADPGVDVTKEAIAFVNSAFNP